MYFSLLRVGVVMVEPLRRGAYLFLIDSKLSAVDLHLVEVRLETIHGLSREFGRRRS